MGNNPFGQKQLLATKLSLELRTTYAGLLGLERGDNAGERGSGQSLRRRLLMPAQVGRVHVGPSRQLTQV